jgi:two-component system chemotaxis sensor kinase CheA
MTEDDDHEELLELFAEEAREHLDDLGLAVVELERDGGSAGAVNDAFRAAHSLKGMAATMGFSPVVEVAHALEDLLDAIRAGRLPDAARSDAAAALLTAVDVIGSQVAEIARTRQTELPSDAAVARIEAVRAQLVPAAAAGSGAGGGSGLSVLSTPDSAMVDELGARGLRVWCIDLEVSERSLLPGARAWQALRALSMIGELVSSDPPMEQLESGECESRTVSAVLASGSTSEEIEQVAAQREIAGVRVVAHQAVAGMGDLASPADRAAGDVAGAAAVPVRIERGEPDVSDQMIQRAQTVRVDAARLDELMHGVEELLVRRARVQTLVASMGRPDIVDAISAVDRAARQLQDLVMDVRMVSIDSVLRRMPRMVRDLATRLGKSVELEIVGRETQLDRTVVDVLSDPLVHLVRNAIDHGLELPEEREETGKARAGKLVIDASTESGCVWIRVRDDGRGMRPDWIRARAVDRGVVSADKAPSLTEAELLDLCFEPGFSTRVEANDVSGRGVGLDVVRASVRSLGGDVTAVSSAAGTEMTIRLPLTLAIRSVLLARLGDDVYALPTDRVGQTLDLEHHDLLSVAGQPRILHHGEAVPVTALAECLGELHVSVSVDVGHVVLLEAPTGTLGVIVDQVIGQAELVTRPLPSVVRTSQLLSASAVLGDGNVAFLMDVDALVQLTRQGVQNAAAS